MFVLAIKIRRTGVHHWLISLSQAYYVAQVIHIYGNLTKATEPPMVVNHGCKDNLCCFNFLNLSF